MVHHVSEADVPNRPTLLGSPLARAAVLSAIGAVLALGVLVVAVFGGLEKADALADPEPAGTELANDLIRVAPHEARVVSDESEDFLQVRADIEMHGSERPVSTFDAIDSAVAHVGSSANALEDPDLLFQRMPEGYVSHLQPHMFEEDAIISWPLPDGTVPDEVDDVRVAVHEVERIEARGGGGALWVADDGLVGSVSVPLEEAGP